MKKGLYPALITPFDSREEVDENALCDVVEALLKRGVVGFYVGGSTGEVMLLTLEERKRLAEIVVRQTAGRADVVVHIGCQRTRDSIELARHAAGLGADAISALPPIYFKYSLDELTQFYLDIVEASGMPLILYNAPALSGVAFDRDNTERLFQNQRIVGMKYTSFDLFGMQRMMATHPGKVFINGHDELFLSTLALGLRHAIGSTFNFMPEKFTAIREAFEAGEMARAYAVQDQVNAVIEGLMKVGVFRGVKGMMQVLGLPVGSCRRPFRPLNREEMDQLEGLAKDNCI